MSMMFDAGNRERQKAQEKSDQNYEKRLLLEKQKADIQHAITGKRLELRGIMEVRTQYFLEKQYDNKHKMTKIDDHIKTAEEQMKALKLQIVELHVKEKGVDRELEKLPHAADLTSAQKAQKHPR